MTTDSRFFLPRYSSSHIPENMSLDRSSDGSSSPSKDDKFASHKWSRSNTVRKVNSTPNYTKEEAITVKRTSVDDTEVTTRRIFDNLNVEHSEKLRKYLLENTYRQSLESISEYKTKESFATQHLPSRSFESPSSDCTDYMLKTTAAADANNSKNVILSESSSYLSWIESLNSDNLTATEVFTTTDGRTGEWNNFWLNYNNARNLYLRQQNSCSCNSISTTDNTAATDEFLDARSIQKEPSLAHNPDDLLYMTRADMLETIKCCQKIIEILQNAMKTRVDSARDATQQERVCNCMLTQNQY